MAYTNFGSHITEGGSGAPADSYFHIDDVNEVAKQFGAVAVQARNVMVNGTPGIALVAVSSFTPGGTASTYLEGPIHIMALSCPPWTDPVGRQYIAPA